MSMPESLRAALISVGLDPDAKPSKADALRKRANELAKRAHGMISGIPGGQPISSVRDRNKRDKSMRLLEKAADLMRQADSQ